MIWEGNPEAQAFIIKYKPSTKVNFTEEHNSFSFEGTRSISPVSIAGNNFTKTSDGCGGHYEWWCDHRYHHVAGEECFKATDGRVYLKYIPDENCTETGTLDGSGGGGTDYDSGSDGPETYLGGGDPTSGEEEPVITLPMYPDGTSAAPDFLINILGITNSNEKEFIYSNSELAEKFLAFIRDNGSTSDIKSFANEAIKVLMEAGDVNLENKFIKDPSFIGTKAECVLDQLVSTGNNIFRKSSEAFTGGRSQYRLKFTTYFDPGDPANARTPLPNSNGIIEIRFNLAMTALYTNSTSLGLATDLLHEVNHAELHRIKLSENSGPNPLTQAQYNFYIKLWDHFNKPGEYIGEVAGDAEHYYMAKHLIDPISNGLREFENYSHSSFHYRHFAWQGLIRYGKLGGFITETELDENAILAKIVLNDDYISPCDK